MASFNKKISLKVAEQFPEFVQGDNAGVITFIEKYYEFFINNYLAELSN